MPKNVVIDIKTDLIGKDEVYCDWYRCPNCKDEEVRILDKFCSNCGNRFDWHKGSILLSFPKQNP
jgi:hypothetical protein